MTGLAAGRHRLSPLAPRSWRRLALWFGLTAIGLLPNSPGLEAFRELWYPPELQVRIFSAALLLGTTAVVA